VLDADPTAGSNVEMERSAGWLAGVDESYGVEIGGPGKSLALLSAAQVDSRGALNSSFLTNAKGNPLVLAGSGGANDAASLADHVLVVTPYRKGRFVEKVAYTTCSPEQVRWVISEDSVMDRRPSDGRLRLAFYAGDGTQASDIATDFGWETADLGSADIEPELSGEEIEALSNARLSNIRGR
jgi:acyl CoA:acetate/3-ketoacid CoA transferase beta subunit